MLILDGIIDAPQLLTRLQEETLPCSIMLYDNWKQQHAACHDHDHHDHPEGIIYLRITAELAYARLQKRALSPETLLSFDQVTQMYTEKEQLFIENKNSPTQLQNLPVLVLNGYIDFQTDFAQLYNHLFYIRRFYKQIEERKEIALGIHKEKAPQRRCC